MKKNYIAITEHGSIFLGQHLDKDDALNDAVDRFNIHQIKNYLKNLISFQNLDSHQSQA